MPSLATLRKHSRRDAGYFLRVWRAERHLTQMEAAAYVGIKESMWSLVENSKRTPSLTLAVKLAHMTGVPVDELLAKASKPTRKGAR